MLRTILSLIAALLVVQGVASQTVCKAGTKANAVICEGGQWPEGNTTMPGIPENTTELLLFHLTIGDQMKIKPLPAITALVNLTIIDVTTSNPLPLSLLDSLVTKTSILHLTLAKVNIPKLDANHFGGLSGLETLNLQDTGLTFFDSAALTGTKLKTLTIFGQQLLETLSFEALRPVAATLEELSVIKAPKLRQITGSATPNPLLKLSKIMIDGTPLVEVPAVVVNQLTVAVPSIWFTDNANSCSNCTLVAPLVVWIKAATTNAASSLAVTCRATNGATPSQSGTAAQWKDKPDCIPDEVTSTATATVSVAGMSILLMTLTAFLLA